jgi:hypothetical protein
MLAGDVAFTGAARALVLASTVLAALAINRR